MSLHVLSDEHKDDVDIPEGDDGKKKSGYVIPEEVSVIAS
jgi:hypothetical protein